MKQTTEAVSGQKDYMTPAGIARRFFAASMAFTLSVTPAFAQEEGKESGMFDQVDAMAGTLVGWIASAFFFPIYTSPSGTGIPLVVAWQVVGAIVFTLRRGFINILGFKHSAGVFRG